MDGWPGLVDQVAVGSLWHNQLQTEKSPTSVNYYGTIRYKNKLIKKMLNCRVTIKI